MGRNKTILVKLFTRCIDKVRSYDIRTQKLVQIVWPYITYIINVKFNRLISCLPVRLLGK